MLCLSCKGIFLALRRGPWSCDSACSSKLDKKLNVLQIYPWEPDWPAWVSCNLLLLSYPMHLHDDNPELEVWSNGFLLQFWCVKLYNNFYSVKYIGYLNIPLQIVFIVRTVKGTNCLGNLISCHLKKSLLNLSTLLEMVLSENEVYKNRGLAYLKWWRKRNPQKFHCDFHVGSNSWGSAFRSKQLTRGKAFCRISEVMMCLCQLAAAHWKA